MPVPNLTANDAAKRLKQTHLTLKSATPVMTAGVALVGAITTMFMNLAEEEAKAKASKDAKEVKGTAGTTGAPEKQTKTAMKGYDLIDHGLVLLTHLVLALSFIVAMSLLVFFAFIAPPISTTLALTALVVLAFWLSEIASRK